MSKLEFIERQNRRQFFATSTYLGDYRAVTWITSGQRIFVDTRDLGISQHLMFKGYWEKTTNQALLSLLDDGDVYVDVGAHLGYHTLTAAQRVGAGRVVAIEPNPSLYDLLQRSVRINQLRDVVTTHNCAVSDRSGQLQFVCPQDDPAMGHVLAEDEDLGTEAAEIVPVELRTVDDICSDLASVAVMKIDVEGHEWQVLHGAQDTIRRSRDIVLFLEYAPGHIERQVALDEMHGHLEGLGLSRVYEIVDGRLTETAYDELARSRKLRNVVLSRRSLA